MPREMRKQSSETGNVSTSLDPHVLAGACGVGPTKAYLTRTPIITLSTSRTKGDGAHLLLVVLCCATWTDVWLLGFTTLAVVSNLVVLCWERGCVSCTVGGGHKFTTSPSVSVAAVGVTAGDARGASVRLVEQGWGVVPEWLTVWRPGS